MNIKNIFKNLLKFLIMSLIIILFLPNIFYANKNFVDKMGHEVIEIIKPTAESKVDEDMISDALRYVASSETDYGSKNYSGPSKNIYSNDIIYSDANTTKIESDENYTLIRYTKSIANVEDNYELVEDYNKKRLRLKLRNPEQGEWYAMNGFYKINDKIYYFDEDGYMVLGEAKDTMGNEFFFSFETGEMIKGQ